jgi:hypothetical protein
MFKIHPHIKFTVKYVDILILNLLLHIGVPSDPFPNFSYQNNVWVSYFSSNYIFKMICYSNNWQRFPKLKMDNDVLCTVTVFMIIDISSYMVFDQLQLWKSWVVERIWKLAFKCGHIWYIWRSWFFLLTNKNYSYYCSVFYLCT